MDFARGLDVIGWCCVGTPFWVYGLRRSSWERKWRSPHSDAGYYEMNISCTTAEGILILIPVALSIHLPKKAKILSVTVFTHDQHEFGSRPHPQVPF